MSTIAFLEPYLRSADLPQGASGGPELVPMLILSALQKLGQARSAHEGGQWVEKGFYLGRATGVVDALRDALDLDAGGPTAKELGRAYNQIHLCLQQAVMEDGNAALGRAREAICRLSAYWQASSCRGLSQPGTA